MKKRSMVLFLSLLVFQLSVATGSCDEIVRVRLYFGLSLPGGGAVSLQDWNRFRDGEIAKAFEGFNVVDSVGFYKGKPERSKIVTLIVKESEVPKIKKLAKSYAKKFRQDSVMMVMVPVAQWSFIDGGE